MKKGKLTLGIVLGLLIIGFVVAQAQAVSAQDDGSAAVEPFTLRSGNVLSLDRIGSCNDVKVAYQSVGVGMYSLTGYEYGCGYYDRLCFGSMRVVGNTLQIGYVTICAVSCTPPKLGQYNAQIPLVAPYAGPCQWAWHYDGYHSGTATMQVRPGSCSPAAVVSTGSDDSE